LFLWGKLAAGNKTYHRNSVGRRLGENGMNGACRNGNEYFPKPWGAEVEAKNGGGIKARDCEE